MDRTRKAHPHMTLRIDSPTNEYVAIAVVDTLADTDPTSGTLEWCFVPDTVDPSTATTWASLTALTGTVEAAGSWQTVSGVHYARCLVSGTGGGGDAALADGTWRAFVRVTGVGTEQPVIDAGLVVVT